MQEFKKMDQNSSTVKNFQNPTSRMIKVLPVEISWFKLRLSIFSTISYQKVFFF